MWSLQFESLVALDRERDYDRAARACGIGAEQLREVLDRAERLYGRPLVHESGEQFGGFTPMGECVLACARRLQSPDAAAPGPAAAAPEEQEVGELLARRSVSPKRLARPGPSPGQIDLMLQAALSAPDHGALMPWRVIEFRDDTTRDALAELFVQEKLRRDPLAAPLDLRRAKEHATRAPVLLAFVVAPRPRAKIPVREQWLAAGAALCNLLNAAHRLGFGAIMLSGERCYDDVLVAQLGVQRGEFLAGFVSIGRIAEAPPPRKARLTAPVWTRWSPELPAARLATPDEA